MGEFYTPDWLVDVTLDKVEGQFDELKFLDPTCGSASFLLAIIKRIRECSNLSAVDLLQRICGLLTCSLVQKFIASFHIMIQVGDIFKHMRLPEFDERNHQHMHLVELVREAHNENDADVRNNLLTQISDIGNSIIETWTPTE